MVIRLQIHLHAPVGNDSIGTIYSNLQYLSSVCHENLSTYEGSDVITVPGNGNPDNDFARKFFSSQDVYADRLPGERNMKYGLQVQ